MGPYGEPTLDMPPQNVSLSQLGTRLAFFSCRVQWIGNSPRSTHKVVLGQYPLLLSLLLLLLLLFLLLLSCEPVWPSGKALGW